MSIEAMLPSVQRARPTTYWFEWPRSLNGKRAKGQARDIRENRDIRERDIPLERIRDQCEDALLLVKEETGGEVAQTLVGKARGGKQGYAFYLTEMCLLAQGEEIQQLGDVVSSARTS